MEQWACADDAQGDGCRTAQANQPRVPHSRSSASSAPSSWSSSSFTSRAPLFDGFTPRYSHHEPWRPRSPRLSLFRILDELPETKECEATPHRFQPPVLQPPEPSRSSGPWRTAACTSDSPDGSTTHPSHESRYPHGRRGDKRQPSLLGTIPGYAPHPATISSELYIPHREPREDIEKPSRRRRVMTPEEKRKARTCIVDGCSNYIVNRHRCFRHGGGKRCSVDGCNKSAKQRGLCWRHGGSSLCKMEGCDRGVKTKGLCWTHRDQTTSTNSNSDTNHERSSARSRCSVDGCPRTAILSSFCIAHSSRVADEEGFDVEL